MAKLAHMDNIIWQPDGKPAEFVKAMVAMAYPDQDLDEVDEADWLRELEYAPGVPFIVKQVGYQMTDRSRWSVTEVETYMVTGYPGQPEGTVCYIAATEFDGATEMQESEFAGYHFVRPRVTVEFV